MFYNLSVKFFKLKKAKKKKIYALKWST